jgi:hypothetical protein
MARTARSTPPPKRTVVRRLLSDLRGFKIRSVDFAARCDLCLKEPPLALLFSQPRRAEEFGLLIRRLFYFVSVIVNFTLVSDCFLPTFLALYRSGSLNEFSVHLATMSILLFGGAVCRSTLPCSISACRLVRPTCRSCPLDVGSVSTREGSW